MESQEDLQANLDTYKAQLKQVEAALMIDEDNEELIKLKSDLEEVIALTTDLLSINKEKSSSKSKSQKRTFREAELVDGEEPLETEKKSEISNNEDIFAEPSISQPSIEETSKKTDNNDDDDDDDIDFEAMFNLPKRDKPSETESPYDSPKELSTEKSMKSKDKNRLSREEQEKRREQRRKKLLKKQQRLKEIEEQREREKTNWQQFMKGPSKGKGRLKGVIKKSIFASPEASTGKVGIGTCGIGGKGMTSFENPTQYIYKK